MAPIYADQKELFRFEQCILLHLVGAESRVPNSRKICVISEIGGFNGGF